MRMGKTKTIFNSYTMKKKIKVENKKIEIDLVEEYM